MSKYEKTATFSLLNYNYYFHSFRPTNNIGCYHYADKTTMPVFCKYKLIKIMKINKGINKEMIVSASSKVPIGDCISRPINR